ncbi:hypothetical protein [Rodentibacter caecimuris]|uniref:hypothetical protein n=1 Tax=Rodentibacter caecimuris TaxID=1796644 RepID=UPI0013A08CA4|nr:hypothetical protein [Rodentibacter heylii]QIA76701.1 hypothetical protein FEE42_04690 [Rodentibacter heylii]
MFKQELQVINNKRYVVLECQYRHIWTVIQETHRTVTEEQAIEIVNYYLKYKDKAPEQLKVVEVPDILK